MNVASINTNFLKWFGSGFNRDTFIKDLPINKPEIISYCNHYYHYPEFGKPPFKNCKGSGSFHRVHLVCSVCGKNEGYNYAGFGCMYVVKTAPNNERLKVLCEQHQNALIPNKSMKSKSVDRYKILPVRLDLANDELAEIQALCNYYKESGLSRSARTPSGLLKHLAHMKFVELKLKIK